MLGARSLSFGFSYDDFWTILDNQYLHASYGLAGLFDRTAASLGAPDAGRPVMVAIHWVEWRLFGVRSSPYHLVDLSIHAANVALLFVVLFRLTGKNTLAGAASLLFAVHPVHAEAFAVTSFREDTLVTLFGLLWWYSILVAQGEGSKAGEREGSGPWWRAWLPLALQCAAVSFFVLAVGSKESGAALLVSVFLANALLRGRGPWAEFGSARFAYGGAVLALVGLVLFRFWSFGKLAPYSGPVYPHPGDLWYAGLVTKSALAAKTTLFGLGRFLWPFSLSPEYCRLSAPGTAAAIAWILAGALPVALLGWLSWRARRSKGPLAALSAGLVFALVTFAPTSNLFWMPNTEADRFWYLPSVGLVLALAGGVTSLASLLADRLGPLFSRLWHRAGRLDEMVWFWIVVIPVSVTWGLVLQRHLPVYRNDPTLWQQAWKRAPCSPRAAVGQAFGLLHRGRLAEAEQLAQRALSLRPGFPPAVFLLARIAEATGRYDRAGRLYDRALRSGYWKPWRCQVGLARCLLARGKPRDAALHADMARLLAPHRAEAEMAAFDIAAMQGDSGAAGRFLAQAVGAAFF